jgi:hypothetical protein
LKPITGTDFYKKVSFRMKKKLSATKSVKPNFEGPFNTELPGYAYRNLQLYKYWTDKDEEFLK